MSSRADSTSPPPYSLESSSFAPPPPRVGELARNWSYQAKFEASEEPVRLAVLDTITAWTAPRGTQVWDYISRSQVQDAYDAAASDLKKALDFIVDYQSRIYLSDDTDRRQYEYFYFLDSGMKPPLAERPLLSPRAFSRSYTSASNDVQVSIQLTWAGWFQRRGGKYVYPSSEHILQTYARTPHDLKICLNWILDIGSFSAVDSLKDIVAVERLLRESMQEITATKNWVKPII